MTIIILLFTQTGAERAKYIFVVELVQFSLFLYPILAGKLDLDLDLDLFQSSS